MKKKLCISALCVLLIACCILGAMPVSAKLDTLIYNSNGTDAEIGVMSVGEKTDINFSGLPSDYYSKWTNTDTHPEPFWTSSNSTVASVNASGVITAKSAGKAVVTATFQYSKEIRQTKFYVTVTKNKTTAQVVRYSGSDRYRTAIAVCDAGWSTGSTNTLILANGLNYADALVSVPLAYSLNAPILLTAGKSTLEADVSNKIKSLKVKQIIIIGGSGVVSANIENSLKKSGYSVMRLCGSDRFKTATSIADYMASQTGKNPTSAFIATSTGYADALSICSYAAISGTPILYVNNVAANNAPTYNYIKNKAIKSVTAIGGAGVVGSGVLNDIKKCGASVSRVYGADRFLTSLAVAKAYGDSFGSDVMLATGLNFPDALAGGVLAGKYRIPVLLVSSDKIDPQIESYIRLSAPAHIYVLGGTGVIPQKLVTGIL